METYIKTSENQDLNDFLLNTLAWFNYHQLNPNNQKLLSKKKMLFLRELLCK